MVHQNAADTIKINVRFGSYNIREDLFMNNDLNLAYFQGYYS